MKTVARRPAKQIDYQPRPREAVRGSGLAALAMAGLDDGPDVFVDPVSRTAAESHHLGRVKALRCVLCRRLGLAQDGVTEAHHLRYGMGKSQRASDWLTAALCKNACHTGRRGIHGDRSLLRQVNATELDLIAWTYADLAEIDRCSANP